MQIPKKVPTGSIQEIEYFTFSYIHGPWLFILWFHCGFCKKKGKFRVLNGFSHLQTSTNKITIVKNQKLATKNFLFNMHIHLPFGNIWRLFLLWTICLNMFLWNIGIVYFIIEFQQFPLDTPYIPQKRKQILQIWWLYHSRDWIVAVSRPLQNYTESANPIGTVLACFFCFLFFIFLAT